MGRFLSHSLYNEPADTSKMFPQALRVKPEDGVMGTPALQSVRSTGGLGFAASTPSGGTVVGLSLSCRISLNPKQVVSELNYLWDIPLVSSG